MKLNAQDMDREESWSKEVVNCLQATINLAEQALDHPVIKAAVDARHRAAQAAACLPDWLQDVEKDMLHILSAYRYLFLSRLIAFQEIILSTADEQDILEDLASLKALQVALSGPCFQSMGLSLISDLKERYLPTFALFARDRQAWSEVWTPVHTALQKALRIETQDNSLVCPVTQLELAFKGGNAPSKLPPTRSLVTVTPAYLPSSPKEQDGDKLVDSPMLQDEAATTSPSRTYPGRKGPSSKHGY